MNKKIINKFDPFMPIKMSGITTDKMNGSETVTSNFDEFIGEFPGFATRSDHIRIKTPCIKKGLTVVFTRKTIGSENELGEKLLEDFIFSLSDVIELPQYMIFMNEAVYLFDNKNICEYIAKMKKYGVSFLISEESLKHLKYKRRIKEMTEATAADITEKILFSDKIINL